MRTRWGIPLLITMFTMLLLGQTTGPVSGITTQELVKPRFEHRFLWPQFDHNSLLYPGFNSNVPPSVLSFKRFFNHYHNVGGYDVHATSLPPGRSSPTAFTDLSFFPSQRPTLPE